MPRHLESRDSRPIPIDALESALVDRRAGTLAWLSNNRALMQIGLAKLNPTRLQASAVGLHLRARVLFAPLGGP